MKKIFIIILSLVVFSVSAFADTGSIDNNAINAKLKQLEKSFNRRIGLYAIDTNSNQVIAYRSDESFPIQSTFKAIGAADLLKRSEVNPILLNTIIRYNAKAMTGWDPVTRLHIDHGMTLQDLAEATISYSDNAAINLIMQSIDGPKGVTQFANSIGDSTFNVVHYEPYLNSNPKNSVDMSTPKNIALDLQKILYGDVLSGHNKEKLLAWMQNNTTGNQRIRAGLPIGWSTADKTGSGSYGVANDIGVVWSPACRPIILAIYTVTDHQDSKPNDKIVADTTAAVMGAFAQVDQCFNEPYDL